MPTDLSDARILDLSVTLSERLPATWPGHALYAHKNWNWYAEVDGPTGRTTSVAPYQTNVLIIDEHCGTHFDAPTHFIPPPDSGLDWAGEPGSEHGDLVPLADLQGPACVIDVRALAEGEQTDGVSPFIEPSHVEAWEASNGVLQPGDVALFLTGWDRYYVEGPDGLKYTNGSCVTGSFPGWPAPSPATAILLHERGVKCLGGDFPSVGSSHDGVPVHREGLSRRLRYIEALTNLDQVPPRGAWFMFLPIKIGESSGGPGRAIALL